MQTGLSKSSVHRLTQAMERRNSHPESWFWETADGRHWLTRLVVATLYTFGLKRGVGLDTLSEFFARLRLETQVGCSPSALRGVMHALETALLETAGAWEQDACAGAEVREIIGAVDETFLEQMMLVLMDLRTGYLLLEDVAEDRTYTTWKAGVEARLTALGTAVRYLVSDRAKALIQLAEQGLECLSMPDFFHCMHDLVKGSALSLARHVRHARQELTKAEEVLRKHTGPDGRPQGDAEAQHHVEVKRAAVQRWEGVQKHVSPPSGDPLTHAASFSPPRLQPANLCPGPQPTARRSRRPGNVSAGPSVPRTARYAEEGPSPVARAGRAGGFLVGRRRPGFGAGGHLRALEAMGAGVPAAMGLLGAPGCPYALRAEESQATEGAGRGALRV